ncbi:hypothetical protein BDQ12DRAFT_713416 [Crucibulum laeve]|uniref:Uncharacterized protein n=1 Tax=Crucibulum laeve TaxID=68775 RepID=A0A5C3LYZ6_9AGAR|nr:hypothetical protein BDQ12DRAFT_713416 [Crucibulum laeve]
MAYIHDHISVIKLRRAFPVVVWLFSHFIFFHLRTHAAVLSMEAEHVIDDVDALISYFGSWNNYTGSTRQWGGGTTHGTTQVGAYVTFSFRGTSMTVVGTIPVGTETTTGEYSVDGKAPVSASFRSGRDAVYDQTFWQSGTLQDGVHTLTITNKASAAEFLLDCIKYIGLEDISAAPAAPSSITIIPSNNVVSSSASASSASSSSSVDGSSNRSSGVPTGAVVGAVVGGVISIALILLFLFCRRRRARRAVKSGDDTQAALQPGSSSQNRDLTPFPLRDSDDSSAPEFGLMAQIKGAGVEGPVHWSSSAANTSSTRPQGSNSASMFASPSRQGSIIGEAQDGRRFVGASIPGSSPAARPSTVVGFSTSAPPLQTVPLVDIDDVPPAYPA